ncbi:MAG: EFR1 family ferrodoxin [Erysipelotrichales bacterium]
MNQVGIYFSGTGNTRYCVEHFVKELHPNNNAYSIEDKNIIAILVDADEIILGYPIYCSNMPMIVQDFIKDNEKLWHNKKVYIIATMRLFSGDGTGVAARLLKKYNAKIYGGILLNMPDCIIDSNMLKKDEQGEVDMINKAVEQIKVEALNYLNNNPSQVGLGILSHTSGLLGQRLWSKYMTNSYKDKPKIDHDECITCKACINVCPMDNLALENNKIINLKKCTLCYRCVHTCPTKAITLLGRRVKHKPSRLLK